MATPQKPQLFLSHSSKQNDFSWRLYRELLHVNHNPFFDQDAGDASLREHEPFLPFISRIMEACRACKLGIIVLSHEYIESMWTMLELQQLLFHNPSSPSIVYPIFYKLKPTDLFNQENLRRWQIAWDKHAASWHATVQKLHMAASALASTVTWPLDINSMDITLWPKALEMLCYTNGQVLPDNKDEGAFIQANVSNICKIFPPPISFLMGGHFKGAGHIQQEIHKLFQQQQRDEEDPRRLPIAVGLYGVGGSGKTTVCKYMLNFYDNEYPGSCCFLQFPSREEDDSQLLVQSMKHILLARGNWGKESLDMINNVEQAMPYLQELLKRNRVFLVLDNVWEWAFQRAREIVTMDYMPGSRLLVTARSEGVLQNLRSSRGIHVNEALGMQPAMQIVHVPSISEEEAVEALMAYNFTSHIINAKDLRDLARSCFFGVQCHPLLLKAMGANLRHLGGYVHSAQEWTELISHLKAEGEEHTVLNVVKTSFDALDSKLQKTFLDLGTCVPKRSYQHKSLEGLSEWLSRLSHNGSYTCEDIREQLLELEYHGLLQINRGDVVIHDLHMMLIEEIVRDGAPRCLFFEGDLATLSANEWKKLRYISGFLEVGTDLTVLSPQRIWLKHISACLPFGRRATSPNRPDIEVLHLQREYYRDPRHASQGLSMKHMQSLRHLELKNVEILKELGGWHGAPNLVSIKLVNCDKLENIESMACLRRLESLVIEHCKDSGQYRINLSNCENLKRLVIRGSRHLTHLVSLGELPNLQELDLSLSTNLEDVGTLFAYTSLQRCNLQSTGIVKFPDFNSINLRVLDLSSCEKLQSMEGSVCGLTALVELYFSDCSILKSIPDLKALGDLRYLHLFNCHNLKEVRLGNAALKSLESLSLQYCCCFSMSGSPLPISDFTNLGWLRISGDKWASTELSIEVGSYLPVSLEHLTLQNFESGNEITGLSALVNLKELRLEDWPSLTKISGLGPLTKLVSLQILDCGSLREVGHWEAPFISNLESVYIRNCPVLETLSAMRHLPSLKSFTIERCAMLQQQMETVLPEAP